jgi:hypothetical protein
MRRAAAGGSRSAAARGWGTVWTAAPHGVGEPVPGRGRVVGHRRVREAGWETVGEIVDFESTFLLCYVRGPEGLIVELAERLDGGPG